LFKRFTNRVSDFLINLAIRLTLSLREYMLSGKSENEAIKSCTNFVECLLDNKILDQLFQCIVKSFGSDKALTLAYMIKEICKQLNAKKIEKYIEKIINDIEYGIIK